MGVSASAVLASAGERYGAAPEYLWASTPDYAVLRHPASGKWFAVLMPIPQVKIGLPGEKIVDVLNIKADPLMIGSLRKKAAYFPAYHMNKQHWVSILLSAVAEEQEVLELLDFSFRLAAKK